MRILLIAIFLLAAIVIVGFGLFLRMNLTGVGPSTQQTPTSQPTQPMQTQTPSTVQNQTMTIIIKNFAFDPAAANVKKGTKVTWINQDSVPHQVVSDPNGETFKGQVLQQGDSYTVEFDKEGTYNYHCGIHPMMKASVTVTQ